MLKAGVHRLSLAIKAMFEAQPNLLENDKTSAAKKRKDAAASSAAVDDISFEEQQQFSMRMGKYRRHTWKVLQDDLFAGLMQVMHCTREPWIHLSHFLKKKLPRESEGHMHWLVCGKAEAIFSEFSKMLFCRLAAT